MKCFDCPSFDKEDRICTCEPSEIDDTLCLLRNICWLLNIKIQDDRDIEDEGEEWKGEPQS